MNGCVCAVAQGLRGDKGEPGSPGLPGFSGPKGPPVSAAFDKRPFNTTVDFKELEFMIHYWPGFAGSTWSGWTRRETGTVTVKAERCCEILKIRDKVPQVPCFGCVLGDARQSW